jgi:alkylhydroperoxidase/carboxymuconolactone decarboxylase family protein YurZ
MSQDDNNFAEMTQQFGHATAAIMDVTRHLNEQKFSPAVLASATCANYVAYVAAMAKLVGSTEQEAFDTCLAGIHQMRDYVREIYTELDKKAAAQ